MKNIVGGKRPSRPLKGKKFGLSDELWRIIQSLLVHEVGRRPPVSTFVDFLEKTSPDIAMLKELAEFDVNSEEYAQKLPHVFAHAGNTLLGMRENESLAVIEVFDRVRTIARYFLTPRTFLTVWIQVLNFSSADSTLRGLCLYGLQSISARCGLLPKSYWISHSDLTDGAPSVTGRVSSIRQWSMDGRLVAVKTINPDCIENPNAFKCVRPPLFRYISYQRRSLLGSYRDCAPKRSFGSVCSIQM